MAPGEFVLAGAERGARDAELRLMLTSQLVPLIPCQALCFAYLAVGNVGTRLSLFPTPKQHKEGKDFFLQAVSSPSPLICFTPAPFPSERKTARTSSWKT